MRCFQTKGYEKAYREGLSKLQLRDNQEATLAPLLPQPGDLEVTNPSKRVMHCKSRQNVLSSGSFPAREPFLWRRGGQ
jgi:hypothetical protein